MVASRGTNSFDFILYNCSMPAVVCVLCYLGQKLRNRSLIFPLLLQTCKLGSVLPTTEVTGKKSTVCFNIFQQNRNSVSFLLDEIIRLKIRKNGWKQKSDKKFVKIRLNIFCNFFNFSNAFPNFFEIFF